jgi:hypothetical protein
MPLVGAAPLLGAAPARRERGAILMEVGTAPDVRPDTDRGSVPLVGAAPLTEREKRIIAEHRAGGCRWSVLRLLVRSEARCC